MIIEDTRKTEFYELKKGDVFYFANENNYKIVNTRYGVCMKIDDGYYYNFNMNEVLNTTDNKVVFPLNAKLVLY